MNSNNSSNSKKIQRRSIFLYLGAGAAAVAALTGFPFKLFQKKVIAETSIKIKTNPYAVKRENVDRNGGNI